MTKKRVSLLGDHPLAKTSFSRLDSAFKKFEKKNFKTLPNRLRNQTVSQALLELIQEEPEPCFLLAAVLEFIERVDQKKILPSYSFSSFELWLNQSSSLTFEENYRIRAKIAGKFVERSDYQLSFPIGMGKVYEGTHFVTAHKSPDLDTTVASFWGWLDAFAARVGSGLHIWNLPDGPPLSQIEIEWVFRQPLGAGVFTHLPKTRNDLNLTGKDLMTQKGMQRKTLSDSIGAIDHERDQGAVVVTDDEGFYLGDWRHFDVEGVRQMISLLSSCLRWFENSLNLHLISLFARDALRFDDLVPSLHLLMGIRIGDCEIALEFTPKQKQQVADFLTQVLEMRDGLNTSFDQLSAHLCALNEMPYYGLKGIFAAMEQGKLFDAKGNLKENRPSLFKFLEKSVEALHGGVTKMRSRLEKLDIALKTKQKVLGRTPTFVTTRSDVDEIRNKMASYPYLTVVYPDQDRLFPVGIIQSAELRKGILGTVSLRDFCNREEMAIPSYLEVISVIDHHKSSLNTFAPPTAILSDAQSSNTLVAQIAFQINDAYSLLGQTPTSIEEQVKAQELRNPESIRILQRLLKKSLVAGQKKDQFIHPDREFLEYLHFLYAILDDTDLLSKVSPLDVECVVSLLNRLKSLSRGIEVEILSLDDLPRDKNFPRRAAERILQNEDMYSLYRKVYEYREGEVTKNITLAAKGSPSNFFADTKEQNGCCRIGQTKLFACNLSHFEKHASAIRRVWLDKSMSIHKEKPEIDLYIHMLSTIVSAEEVYRGSRGSYTHLDELWIYIPEKESAVEHLKRFLSLFQASPGLKNSPMEVEFLGSNGDELSAIFKESFTSIPHKKSKGHLPIAILRYQAGALNSRKAMVSPFLPSLK